MHRATSLRPRFLSSHVPIPPPDEPPPSDNILRDLLDNDLITVARIATVVDTSLQAKADTFDSNRIDELRVPLQKDTLAALAGASTDQTLDFLQKSAALFMWNARGDQIVDEATGKTVRQGMCELISSATAKVDQSIRDCMCGTADPYIRCQMMLGNEALAYGSARSAPQTRYHHAHVRRVQGIPERKTQATCDLQSTPSNLLSSQSSFIDILNVGTNIDSLQVGSPEIEIEGSCCFDLQPPPLNVLEACGAVSVSIPNVEFLTLEGAQVQLDNGIIEKGSDALKEEAGGIDVALSLSICFALSEKVPGLAAILEYLGIDLCFAEQALKMWPARGSAEFSLEVTIAVFKASIGLQWQTSTALRDTLGLCDGVEPSCNDKDTFFCSMGENGVVGFVDLSVDFNIYQETLFDLPIGEGINSHCKDLSDGTLCLLGSSCQRCQNPATYWYGPAFTACGNEPGYADGTTCLPGFSCQKCENPSTYWYGPALQKCGQEPKYEDGTTCLPGFSCENCLNPSTYWYGPAVQKCGPEPKYEDGTTCLPELSCQNCLNPSTYWYGPALQKCGPEPKYEDGTTCLPELSCANCLNPSTYWYGPALQKCGPEPKYEDGTTCLPGFSCESCLNPSTYWYGPAVQKCGPEPKYEDGTTCLPGFSCENCLNPSTYWYGPALQKCGNEPCWGSGTFCLIGTSCNSCCNGQSWSFCN